MKIFQISRLCSLFENNKRIKGVQKKRIGTRSSSSKIKNVKVVEEDEMDTSMLNPGAPMDNLGNGDSFATGDFRLPTVLGPIQRRNKKGKSKKRK